MEFPGKCHVRVERIRAHGGVALEVSHGNAKLKMNERLSVGQIILLDITFCLSFPSILCTVMNCGGQVSLLLPASTLPPLSLLGKSSCALDFGHGHVTCFGQWHKR